MKQNQAFMKETSVKDGDIAAGCNNERTQLIYISTLIVMTFLVICHDKRIYLYIFGNYIHIFLSEICQKIHENLIKQQSVATQVHTQFKRK